jgi:uncharacterized protein YfaS (alpha-2-macroglobulin family)
MRKDAMRSRLAVFAGPVCMASLLSAGCPSDGQTGLGPRRPRDEGPVAVADGPLSVTFVSPQGPIWAPAEIAAGFSKPMVPLDRAGTADAAAVLRIEPPVAGEHRWLGSQVVTFVPDGPLPLATRFTVTVPAGLAALDDDKLAAARTWTFETPRLRVARTDPYRGARHRKPDSPVDLWFNQPVAPEAVARHARFEARLQDGTRVRRDARARVGTLRGRGEPDPAVAPPADDGGPDPRHLVLTPADPLPLDAEITLLLSADLQGVEGNLPMGEEWSLAYRTYGPLEVEEVNCTETVCDPYPGLVLRFSNPVKPRDVRERVRFDPPLAVAAGEGRTPEEDTTWIHLAIDPAPRTEYALTIAGSLTDRFGQTLGEDRTFTVRYGSYPPEAFLDLDGSVIEASGPHQIQGRFRNAGTVDWRVREADVQDVLASRFGRYDARQPALADRTGTASRVLQPNPAVDVRRRVALDLDPAFRGVKRGFVQVELWRRPAANERATHPIRRLLRVTDLGLTTKLSPQGMLVWVTSLQTGRAVAGANVAVYRAVGDPVWTGRTDAAGLAFAPADKIGRGAQYYPAEFVTVAEKAGDRSFVGSSDSWSLDPWSFDVPFAWRGKERSLVGTLFEDRDIYRPGDRVHVKGILRWQTDDGLETPRNLTFEANAWTSDGQSIDPVRGREVTVGPFGTLDFDVEIPSDAPLGYYQLVARQSDADLALYGSFRVAEYQAPTFAVTAESDRSSYVRGETLRLAVQGEYLFGAPMAGASVRWWAHRSTTGFRPENPDYESYRFGAELPWWESAAEAPDAGALAEDTGGLDARGRIEASVPLDLPPLREPLSIAIEGEVTDLDRSTVSGRRSVTVHPGEFYLGVRRAADGLLRAGESLVAEVIALTPEGRLRPGVAATGILYRREWHTTRQEGMGGRYDYQTRPEDAEVGRCAVVTADAAVKCDVRLPEPGQYVLRLEATDGRGNPIATTFTAYAYGPGTAAWYRSDDGHIGLVPDKEIYRPGDTARILVQNPFPEAEMLYTVERAGIPVRQSRRVTGPAPVLEIPILESYRPNVYVSVMLVRGRTAERPGPDGDDAGKPAFAVGLQRLTVETDSKRLRVEIRPERETYAPGEEIAVAVETRDASGTGVTAEVTLFAVDEAVLQLTGYQLPDPMELFWSLRPLSVRTSEIRQQLASRLGPDDDKGEEGGGGGGGAGGTLRTDFRTVAYWNPGLLTDADGRATVRFRLPEKLTRYRLMALVATEADRFGRATSAVRIAKPLLLRPSLPRFLSTGDRFEAGVVVTLRDGAGGSATVTAEVEGVRLEGDAARTVTLAPGASAEVRFPFTAGAPGDARFRFRARMGDLEDGFEMTRPVRLPLIPETVAAYGETLTRAVEAIGDLDLVRPDYGRLAVGVSSSALTGLDAGMRFLFYYPYDCTEQLVSRIVPVVALADLCEGLGLEMPADADAVVRKAIAEIPRRQRSDGGFGFWSDSVRSDPWLTAYAVWGFIRARERGYAVPERVMERALQYLAAALRRNERDPQQEFIGLASKAFILYVLADAGEPEAGYQEALYDARDDLPLFAKGFLAGAFLLSDDACAAMDCVPVVELRRDIENHAFLTAEKVHFEENVGDLYRALMQSDVTTTAILLDVLLRMDPAHPLATGLVRWILDKRDGGHWSTTQNSAWALLALARFHRVRESEPADFTATLDFGDRRILSERFAGPPARETTHEIPMGELMSGRGRSLVIERQGPSGRLYYALSLQYARRDLPADPIDRGFHVERRYEIVDLAALRDGAGLERPAEPVLRARAGDLVRVQVSIVTPQERTRVVLDDPLPAGLQSIDFDLRTTTLTLRRAAAGYAHGDDDPYGGYRVDDYAPDDYGRYGGYGGYDGYDGYDGYGDYDDDHSGDWWWSPFYHRQDRDDRVLLFADELPAGVHHYEYLARAVTPGTFVVGPARAEEMYNPETFGRTGAVEFVVDPPRD